MASLRRRGEERGLRAPGQYRDLTSVTSQNKRNFKFIQFTLARMVSLSSWQASSKRDVSKDKSSETGSRSWGISGTVVKLGILGKLKMWSEGQDISVIWWLWQEGLKVVCRGKTGKLLSSTVPWHPCIENQNHHLVNFYMCRNKLSAPLNYCSLYTLPMP